MRLALRIVAAALLLAGSADAQTTEFAADRAPVVSAGALVPTPATLPVPKSAKNDPLLGNNLPIDLPTALRLANVGSPTIAIAQARIREALARVDQANALILPTLSTGGIYTQHSGLIQRTEGPLESVDRQSMFAGGGLSLRVDFGETYFSPLVARRLVAAEVAAAQATTNSTQYDAAAAYFELVQAHGLLAVNADILTLDEQILKAARSGEKQGLIRSAADVNRAETEVSLRRTERLDLQARAGVASARLVRLLVLDPAVTLVPADAAVVPIELFAPTATITDLVGQAVSNRPELAAALSLIEAADIRVRQARLAPLIPRAQISYLGGGFGGGPNGAHPNLDGRGDVDAQLFWELRGLGFGNLADVRVRSAERDRTVLNSVAVRAQVAADVVEAASIATARRAAIDEARQATNQAQEMYRKLSATSFGMIGPRAQFDALEPLLAVQALSQAKVSYLGSVVEFNRSQFRLLTAIGQPADAAMPKP